MFGKVFVEEVRFEFDFEEWVGFWNIKIEGNEKDVLGIKV